MRLFTICLVLLVPCAGAFAMFRDNVPLSKDELATRVKLKREVLPCNAEGTAVIKQVTIKGTNKLTVSGTDAKGKPWLLVTESINCQVWHGDLDGDGVEDFVFITGYSGSAKALFILFDADKRPVPWLVGGYLEHDADGLPELVDLNHDGRAELIYMLPQKTESGTEYWVTDLYEANAGIGSR